jgi:drug/metabolite transporter (DMT)-like permease
MRTDWQLTVLLLVPGTIWGISFLLTEVALETIPPLTITAARTILAVLLFWGVMRWYGQTLPPFGRAWIPYFILGLFNDALPYVLTTFGQVYIEGGLATILISMSPIFTLILAHFFTPDEVITREKLVGVLIGLAGILVLIGPQALAVGSSILWAQLAVVFSALSYAIGTIYMRHLLSNRKNQRFAEQLPQTLTGQLICTGIYVVPLSLLFEQPWQLQPKAASIYAILAMVFFGSGIALGVYYYLLDRTGPTFVSVVVYLIPINGVFWGAVFLNEKVGLNALVALGLILLGILVVNGRFRPKQLFASRFR